MTSPATPHIDDELWARHACHELNLEERAALAAHVRACPSCAEIHEGLGLLHERAQQFDRGVPRPIPFGPLDRPSPRLWRHLSVLAAAAALVAVVAGYTWWPVANPSTRDTTSTPRAVESGRLITLVQPLDGSLGAVGSFRWVGSERADRYVVQVFTEDGTRVWESAAVRDTTVMLPAGSLGPGKYLWSVTALAGARSVGESPLAVFEIGQ